jgi:hypothetical protein
MKHFLRRVSINTLFCLCIYVIGCSPDDDPAAGGGSGADDKPTLVSDLNGFQYEGTLKETLDPKVYASVTINHLETYKDSVRVFFSTLDNRTGQYRWTVQNRFKGKVTREFNLLTFQSSGLYKFAFDHENFLLYGYEKSTSTIDIYPRGKNTAYYVSKPNNNFPYRFNENYTVFFGSAVSIYVYENKAKKYMAPAPAIAHVLTSESSVAWADYILEDDELSPSVFRDGIYTGFFNATLDKFNYIGIAKGQQTLDTLVINKNPPSMYYPITEVYMSRVGNKIYLGLIKIKALYSTNDVSVYEMDVNEKIIRPVFKNVAEPNQNGVFIRGKFYYYTQVLTSTGQLEDSPLPKLLGDARIMAGNVFFGETKIFVAVQKDGNLVELYSRPY